MNRGIRSRSRGDNEEWAKGLDADPESVEWMTAVLIAQVCAFSAKLERQSITRRTRAGLDRARGEGKRLSRPPRLDDEQMSAIHQDLAAKMTMAAVGRKYGIPRSTLRDYLARANAQSQ